MSQIKVMSESLSNKIAAGEVVERPKSIVKELVENALDAGATTIKIVTEGAGIKKIMVEDDGKGMSMEDAKLAFLRHATSKIFSEDDLFKIGTLGFRGEALAAIASVSEVTLHTGLASKSSTIIKISSGVMESVTESDGRIGTNITVENLFYNTPARLKHLKSLYTEYMHITEYLQKMALARPDIRFEYIQDDKQVFQTFGTGKLDETLVMIYGDKIAGYMYEVEKADTDFSISGIISHPQMQRASNKVMSISINQRTVRHYGINRAIIAAYGNLLPKGMYPIVAFDIKVDNQLVDVNVHPAKLEVRLSQEAQIEQLVKSAIEDVLANRNLIYKNVHQPKKIRTSEQFGLSLENHAKSQKIAEDVVSYQKLSPQIESMQKEKKIIYYPNKNSESGDLVSKPRKDILQSFYQRSNLDANTDVRNDEKAQLEVVRDVTSSNDVDFGAQNTAVDTLQQLSIIGQFDATYIIGQKDHALYLIDQHAAQERIKYEEHMQKVRAFETITVQELLFPLVIILLPEELKAIKLYGEDFQKNGILFEKFGENEIRINGVPSWINKTDIEVYVRKAIASITKNKAIDSAEIREQELIMLSCKYSIKANDILSIREMEVLIDMLSKTKTPYTCPHGRPIIIEYTKGEVERWFKRA
ncbi:methyl-directed mismatch repair protein MutL [Erysipelotrichaceae bacterium]|nr:methyl-directed mismatch repair protein MutL [Erysipelotrichaceae bacterium]